MSNSAAQLLGILCLINGHKTTISGRPYAEYTTAIATLDGRSPAAVVRIWQKPGASLLVNNTCVLTLAKISVTRDDTPWVIEPIIIHPFPGDPNDDQYDNALPDFPVPVMILTGTVLSATTNAIAPYNAPTKAFVVATSEFVCGSVVTYSLRACFDPSSPKWTKVPVPNVGNNIFVVGHFRGVYNNTLHLDVESIVLNMGVGSNNGSLTTPTSSPDEGKKRKFSAIATMNSPSSGDKSPAVKKIRFEMPPPMVIATETASSDDVPNGTLEGDAVIVNDETTAAPDPVVPLRIVDESQVVSAKFPVHFCVSPPVATRLALGYRDEIKDGWVTISVTKNISSFLAKPIKEMDALNGLATLLTPMTFMYQPIRFQESPVYSDLRALFILPQSHDGRSLLSVPFRLEIDPSYALRHFAMFLVAFMNMIRGDCGDSVALENAAYCCGFRFIFGCLFLSGDFSSMFRRNADDPLDMRHTNPEVDVVTWPFSNDRIAQPETVLTCITIAKLLSG